MHMYIYIYIYIQYIIAMGGEGERWNLWLLSLQHTLV